LFELGAVRINLADREVTVEGKRVHLTPNEFRLLAVLVKNAGRVMTHRHLLREVWGPGSGEETHYLRVYINQLRLKLESNPARPKYLLTEAGVGYRLAVELT
jgi:two-component system KDP operon response regulator KdpE